MLVIPAIDIKERKCVRLRQGRMDEETVYSDDPVAVAKKWESMGAKLIHVVDLDGALCGTDINFDAIKDIASSVQIPVQVGGGIRTVDTAERYLSLKGVKRIIIGTAACEDDGILDELTGRHPGRIAVGIDAKDGFVAVRGWIDVTDIPAKELALRLEKRGVACIIYTDISRDGMLAGPNVEAVRELKEAVSIPVIASGGVSSLKDIESLLPLGLEGVIIGKALYTGDIDLGEAVKKAEGP